MIEPGNAPGQGTIPAVVRRWLSSALLIGGLLTGGGALAPELAAAPADVFDFNVSVKCQGGSVQFMIVNTGTAWPEPGKIEIYWTEVKRLVHERRLRLGAGQRVTFRIPGVAGKNFEFGLWINPSWFERPFDYDARIKCD